MLLADVELTRLRRYLTRGSMARHTWARHASVLRLSASEERVGLLEVVYQGSDQAGPGWRKTRHLGCA